jgi:hypothetical protein
MPTTDWSTTYSSSHRQRHWSLLGVGVLHALIAAAWLAARPHAPAPAPGADARRIQWMWLSLPKPRRREQAQDHEPAPAAKPMPERVPRSAAPIVVRALPLPPPVVPDPVPVPATPSAASPPAGPAPAETTAAAQPATSAADLVANARRMAGTIDKQLRKEAHQPLPAFVDTPYKRFEADMAAAYVPQWTGVATTTEIAMPGTGERLIKVSNGSSSYCLRIPSPSMGIDRYEASRVAKPMTCPH